MIKLKFVFFGVIAAFGALAAELALGLALPVQNLDALGAPLILFAVIEEFSKSALIYKSLSPDDALRDFLAKAFFVGLGFALTEICLANLGISPRSPIQILPFAGILLVHIAGGLIFAVSFFRLRTNPGLAFSCAIIPPIILHLAYNSLIIYASFAK